MASRSAPGSWAGASWSGLASLSSCRCCSQGGTAAILRSPSLISATPSESLPLTSIYKDLRSEVMNCDFAIYASRLISSLRDRITELQFMEDTSHRNFHPVLVRICGCFTKESRAVKEEGCSVSSRFGFDQTSASSSGHSSNRRSFVAGLHNNIFQPSAPAPMVR